MSHDPTMDAPVRSDPEMARLLDGLQHEPGPGAATRDALWQRIAADLPGGAGGSTAESPRARAGRAPSSGGVPPLAGVGAAGGSRTWTGPWLAIGGVSVLATLAAIAWLLQPPPEPVVPAVTPASPSAAAAVAVEAVEAPPRGAVAAAAPAQAAPEAPAAAAPAAEPVAEPVAIAEAPAAAPVAAVEPEPATARPRPPLRPEDALKVEVELLGRARAALDHGSPDAALAALRHHGRRFADGQLAEEREALEIVALARLGKVGAAQSKANRFLRQHSRSLHSQAVRDAIAGLAP